jgi:hypothetical protein
MRLISPLNFGPSFESSAKGRAQTTSPVKGAPNQHFLRFRALCFSPNYSTI